MGRPHFSDEKLKYYAKWINNPQLFLNQLNK